MINSISKITIYVNNQEDAKKFWTEKMEFIVTAENPMGPELTWLEVAPSKTSTTSFVLYLKEAMKNQNPKANVEHPTLILSTTDIASVHKKMKANGIEVEDLLSMPYGKMFKFKDQDGNDYLLREDQ